MDNSSNPSGLSSSLRPGNAAAGPARVVSDIQPPARSVSQIAIATNARVQQIWEEARRQGQTHNLPSIPTESDSTSSDSASSSEASSEAGEEAGEESRVLGGYTKESPAASSSDPIPEHFSLTLTTVDLEDQRKRSVQQSTDDDLDSPPPKRARAEAARMALSPRLSSSVAPSSRQSTGGDGASLPRSSSRISSRPNYSAPNLKKSVYDLIGQDRHVKVLGKTFPVIVDINNHSYRILTEASGEQKPACGALIPEHYRPEKEGQYTCPVRGCGKVSEKINGLGGHFSMSHKGLAFNDNLDGTLSPLGAYEADVTSFPAVVVSRRPNTVVLPPVHGYTASVVPPKVVVPPRPPLPSTYLDNILSQKQTPYTREDIVFMKSLPVLRELPRSWETRHTAKCPDEDLYAILLAFTVGEEVSIKKCTRFKKMGVSIRIPSGMPKLARDRLSSVESCVSCLYYNYRRPKNPSPCNWTPDHELQRLGISQSIEGRSRSADSAIGLPSSALKDEKSASQSGVSGDEGDDDDDEEELKPNLPLPPKALRKRPGRSKDDSSRMEDWEFAPGKQIDEASGEPFAFSAPYVTSQNAIQVADDIGFHRLRIPPGGVQHWKVNKDTLRSCEVISGKLDIKVGDVKAQPIGMGGVFVIRPGMKFTAENRQYNEAVVSCYNFSNYSLTET